VTAKNTEIGELLRDVKRGDRLALSRAVTIAEKSIQSAAGLISKMDALPARAKRIGITGPPGVGKSTLISRLLTPALAEGFKIGLILVDPTSELTGGSLLGDRVRLGGEVQDEKVYVRSIASRGAKGGSSFAAAAAAVLMEHWGASFIFVESVGVGQTGGSISDIVDFTCLVLAPGSGDSVQTLKAGLLETSEVFIVNKCDLPGADALAALLEAEYGNAGSTSRHIVRCSAGEGSGVTDVWRLILRIYDDIEGNPGAAAERLQGKTAGLIRELVEGAFSKALRSDRSVIETVERLAGAASAGKTDPYSAAEIAITHIISRAADFWKAAS
jgi:LAO/AO transport system kinase